MTRYNVTITEKVREHIHSFNDKEILLAFQKLEDDIRSNDQFLVWDRELLDKGSYRRRVAYGEGYAKALNVYYHESIFAIPFSKFRIITLTVYEIVPIDLHPGQSIIDALRSKIFDSRRKVIFTQVNKLVAIAGAWVTIILFISQLWGGWF